MRKLDFWLGIPLCFLFNIFRYSLKIMDWKRKPRAHAQKVLFIKLSELGAIILSYPLLKKIKTDYPGVELFFITFAKNKDIFKVLGNVVPDENILLIKEDFLRAFVTDTFRVIKRIRREKIDIVFNLEFFSRFSSLLTYSSGAVKRIGFYRYTFEGLYCGNLLTHRMQYNPLSHMSHTYLSLIQGLKRENKDSPELEELIDPKEIVFPKYISRPEFRESILKKLKNLNFNPSGRIFLLNPGEGVLSLREWPLDNFISLIKRLLDEPDNRIIIIGTKGTEKKGKVILETLNNPRCINFINQTGLEELMELFLLADALISNDCGLAHLAMLCPLQKFIIFGPESPQVFAPLDEKTRIIYSNLPCSPCLSVLNHRDSDCRENKCLKIINPQDVYGLIKRSL